MNDAESDRLETGDPVLSAIDVTCRRQDNGHLVLTHPRLHVEDVHLISTFPLSRPQRMVVVRDSNGNEVAFLDDVSKLDADSRHVVAEELERSYFMPRITEILNTEEKLNVLTIEVETDRGPRTIQIRNARRSIRKLSGKRVIICDVDSNRYEIGDWTALSAYGRDFLAQYL